MFVIFWIVFSLYAFYTNIRPEKFSSMITPKDFNKEYENITLYTQDGLKLSAWFLPNKKVSDKAIIILHGYPADKSDLLASYLFLHERYSLLFVDFRYFGESEGKYTTIGIKEVEDVLAAVKFLQERQVKKIGIFGFSMGGATALMTLSKIDAINAVVSQSAYAGLDLMAENQYKYFYFLKRPLTLLTKMWGKLIFGIDISTMSPRVVIQNIQAPILIIHSKQDDQIPFSHALILRDALKNNLQAEFWFQDSLIHGENSGAGYEKRIIDFFAKYL